MRNWILSTLALAVTAAIAAPVADNDPYLWLADIHGDKPLAWVKEQNARSDAALKADPRYARAYDAILASLDVTDRIPLGRLDHGDVYNFRQDKDHVRGVWRRTTAADYAKPSPNWETLLDIDKLDADEKAQWVFQGADCAPGGERCLIKLSPGGGDAATIREFDLKTKTFVEDGFVLPLSKVTAVYLDADNVLVATDFGPDSLTKSSYPRFIKVWRRGHPLSMATMVFGGSADDVWARPSVYRGPYGTVALLVRGRTFFTADYHYLMPDRTTLPLPLPPGADIKGVIGGKLIFSLREAWQPLGARKPFPRGALLAFAMKSFALQRVMPIYELLYAPAARNAIGDVSVGRDAVYASIYDNVTGSVHAFRDLGGRWSDTKLALPAGGSTVVVDADPWGPEAHFTFESFLEPPTLYATDGSGAPKPVKRQAPLFDAGKFVAEQFWVRSKDGARVPYFLIHAKGAHGPVPTILYSYGGFELSLTPWYWNDGHRPLDAGQVWLAKGGAIAVANIRGGGEFGPAWHQAALKANRQKAFDDFAAVARDLARRRVTTPRQLGIVGASNGGVLTTVTMTQHPELIAAVVCQRPLIDMLRYTRFGAGASWIGEYGDPARPAERAYIARYSAYQNVRPKIRYPAVFFITETSDDRVTPIWARMMAAKMLDQHHDVLFNESNEGGHGPGATNAAQAEMWALSYTYLAQKLGLR
ncbi:MAG TPA: prolyl oligopeptidase family serine peptidase [Rhizomicrobium sp.]